MTSLSFSEYLELSPAEQTLADCVYWRQFTDPKQRRFLAGLLRMALDPAELTDQKPGRRVSDLTATYVA